MWKVMGAIAVAAALAAPGAQAAVFKVTGGEDFVLGKDYNPKPGSPDVAPGATAIANGALALGAKGHVTFSYVGTEAGYRNTFWFDGAQLFDNKAKDNPAATFKLGPGAVPFEFRTASPSAIVANGMTTGFYNSIAFVQTGARTVYALFNDGAKVDRDYDDLVVRMDVKPVPLPAAAWLLLGGIAALGAASRRRRAAV